MELSATQVRAAHHRRSGMVDDVCVPSGPDFKGSDFSVLSPDDERAKQYLQHLSQRNISGAERRPS